MFRVFRLLPFPLLLHVFFFFSWTLSRIFFFLRECGISVHLSFQISPFWRRAIRRPYFFAFEATPSPISSRKLGDRLAHSLPFSPSGASWFRGPKGAFSFLRPLRWRCFPLESAFRLQGGLSFSPPYLSRFPALVFFFFPFVFRAWSPFGIQEDWPLFFQPRQAKNVGTTRTPPRTCRPPFSLFSLDWTPPPLRGILFFFLYR